MSSAFIREDLRRSVTPVRERMWYGEFSKDVASFADTATVIVPDFDPTIHWENVVWQTRDASSLPQKGDPCLVAFDNRNQPWVLSWQPAATGAPSRVTSVFGRSGVVVAQAGDYDISQITNGEPKSYIDAGDASALASAKSYADSGDAATLASAESYANARGPKTTVSAFASGPPASPSNGDIWIATGISDGSGVTMRWTFCYNSGSASANKWEFIGGPPLAINGTGYGSGYSLSAWIPFNGSAWGTGRPGDYLVWGSYSGPGSSGGAATYRGGIMLNFGSGYNAPSLSAGVVSANTSWDFEVVVPPTNCSANGTTTIALGYWLNATPGSLYHRSLVILPMRVS